MRSEWFRDDDGVRVAPVGDFQGNNTASAGGFAGNFYEAALGLNYRPNANLLIRPELRFDWYDGPAGNGGILPYDDGTDSNQTLVGVDVILTY